MLQYLSLGLFVLPLLPYLRAARRRGLLVDHWQLLGAAQTLGYSPRWMLLFVQFFFPKLSSICFRKEQWNYDLENFVTEFWYKDTPLCSNEKIAAISMVFLDYPLCLWRIPAFHVVPVVFFSCTFSFNQAAHTCNLQSCSCSTSSGFKAPWLQPFLIKLSEIILPWGRVAIKCVSGKMLDHLQWKNHHGEQPGRAWTA